MFISSLVGSDISSFQDQQLWTNWTVQGALGESFEVYQVSGNTSVVLNFGEIDSNNFQVSSQVNTSQLGSYTITLKVFDASSSNTDNIHLSITATPVMSIRSLMVWVVGSVAVATNVVAGTFWRKNAKPKGPRTPETEFKVVSSSTRYPTEEDQLYLSTTHIAQILFLQSAPPEIIHFEIFKEIERPAALHEMILKEVIKKSKERSKIDNEEIKIFDTVFYLTCLSITNLNLSIAILSNIGIHPVFISKLKSAVGILFQNEPSLKNGIEEFAQSLTETLHLNRSFDYDLPTTLKSAILRDDYVWKTSVDEGENEGDSSLREINDDLKDMSVNKLQEMLKFMGEKWKEMKKGAEDDIQTGTGFT